MSAPMPRALAFGPEIQAQLTALLYRNVGVGQTVNALVATAVVYLGHLGLAGQPSLFLFAWWAWMLLLSLGRYALARRYQARAPAVDAAAAWRTPFLVGVVLTSTAWLIGAGFIMWHSPEAIRFMIGLTLAGLVAGAVPVLASVNLAFRLYAIPILLGVALINFAYASDPVHWVFGVLTLIFLGAALRSARYLNETLEASIRLGLEKTHLATDLERARRVAEAASLAKSRFLATMSHEIRTPMNGVLGMAQLLLQPNLDAAEREDCARTILTSGQTLLTLLSDILDFSKIEAGKFELESNAFEPRQIIRETELLFVGMASQKGLRLHSTSHSLEDRRYLGDPHRLRQMLANLVSNALKFTDHGEIRIDAREVARDESGAMLEFSVSDTGIGIPADKQALLFQPFSQTDNSITRQYGGTGLGLSIVRSLAQLMGGAAGVESEVGKGSRFWFRIRTTPIAAGEDTRQAQRAGSAQARSAPALPRLSGRVLVVEDNPVNQKIVSLMLAKLGLTVFLADDGQQGVDAITRGDPVDLVLMDVQMPVLDGHAATRQIRQWEQQNDRPRLPVVALTADAFEEDRQRCLAAGMDDFLVKPVAVSQLQATLGRWLGNA